MNDFHLLCAGVCVGVCLCEWLLVGALRHRTKCDSTGWCGHLQYTVADDWNNAANRLSLSTFHLVAWCYTLLIRLNAIPTGAAQWQQRIRKQINKFKLNRARRNTATPWQIKFSKSMHTFNISQLGWTNAHRVMCVCVHAMAVNRVVLIGRMSNLT